MKRLILILMLTPLLSFGQFASVVNALWYPGKSKDYAIKQLTVDYSASLIGVEKAKGVDLYAFVIANDCVIIIGCKDYFVLYEIIRPLSKELMRDMLSYITTETRILDSVENIFFLEDINRRRSIYCTDWDYIILYQGNANDVVRHIW